MAENAHSTPAPAILPVPLELTHKGAAYALRFDHGGAFACPAGIEPSDWRKAVSKRVATLLDLATAYIAALDLAATDVDLEDNADDEPSLGGYAANPMLLDAELDTADAEPSLGWTDMEGRYGNRGMAPTFDPDREVDDADDEPSLGSPETGTKPGGYWTAYAGQPLVDCCTPTTSQTGWARGHGDDDEQTNEDGGDINDAPQDECWMDIEPAEPSSAHPNGAHLSGGGSLI